ncbi:thiol:disulfide interchange protein [Haemophilus paracuniculus]|uniref:Thiol:disulfide interchange protein n=1 Tax=Haemophilus paracuniculus TaxID=734 RepID=A0A1T0AQL0_9PAST|nr:DsbA family protein [Haemophilus paracuniculus]OOR98319.1 thiol:disulfide interchange protein [Haemophilus paracuniculus]
MKKTFKMTLVALSGLLAFNTTAVAADPTAGKEYLEIRQAPSAQKEVVEFFSFYCPHCYNFEMQYKIPSKIKAALPKDAKLVQYHVNFAGRQSENLTRAWALAMALGVEDKVKTDLFEGAQKNTFQSMDDIRAVFLKNGITAEQFDGGINSFAVNGLVNKQEKLAEDFKVDSVPTFFVNDKYKLNMEGFSDSKDNDDFIKRYVDTTIFLLNK